MKKRFTRYQLFFAAIFSIMVAFSGKTFAGAQDTIVVESGFGTLTDAIAGDTLSDGTRANINRVYKLLRGGQYYLNGSIRSYGWPINIVGEAGPATTPPALILPGIQSTGASNKLFQTSGNVTIRNCYLLNLDPLSKINTTVFEIGLDYSRITLDNCVCEYDSWVFIKNNAAHTNFYITNCTFKNESGPNNWSNGHPFDPRQNLVDTIFMQNNTFYDINSSIIGNWSMNLLYVLFDHNTVYNTIKTPIAPTKAINLIVTNNLFYNSAVWGTTRLAGGNAIHLRDTLYMSQGFVYMQKLDDDPRCADTNRVLNWSKNSVYYTPKVWAFWNEGDTNFRPIPILNDTVKTNFILNPSYRYLSVTDSLAIDPGFVKSPDAANLDSMILYCRQMGMTTKPSIFARIFWDGSTFDDNGVHVTWPPKVDFSYSSGNQAYTAARGGYPLGDLNWFPTKKAQWIINDVKEANSVKPRTMDLAQNYPNPFNPSTKIAFSLAKPAVVKLKVFNALGKEVASLINGYTSAGSHEAEFTAKNLSSGVYFYTLEANGLTMSKKMILIK